MTTTIQHQFFFPQSPEAVWEYLTKSELMDQWLMKNDFLPIVGYDFRFTINPVPELNFNGIVHCRVQEIVPHKKLSYSWKCGPDEDKITLDSVVVWTLQPKDNGTELSLVHSGLSNKENFSLFNSMDGGWLSNVNKILKQLNAAMK